MGPTPPGTGVIADATSATGAKSTSPTSLYPRFFEASETALIPTSKTAAPGCQVDTENQNRNQSVEREPARPQFGARSLSLPYKHTHTNRRCGNVCISLLPTFIQSCRTISALPTAATTMSACLMWYGISAVRECTTVTVASLFMSSRAMGSPTTLLRPRITACFPAMVMPLRSSSVRQPWKWKSAKPRRLGRSTSIHTERERRSVGMRNQLPTVCTEQTAAPDPEWPKSQRSRDESRPRLYRWILGTRQLSDRCDLGEGAVQECLLDTITHIHIYIYLLYIASHLQGCACSSIHSTVNLWVCIESSNRFDDLLLRRLLR